MEKAKGTAVTKEELPPIMIQDALKERGYESDEMKDLLNKDVLVLSPYPRKEKEYDLFTPETVEIKKILAHKAEGFKIEFALDKTRERKYLELLAAEIQIGLLVFFALTTWEITKGIIANWLYDRFKAFRKDSKTLHAKLEIQIIDEKRGINYHVKYSGPADKVAEVIEKTKFQ